MQNPNQAKLPYIDTRENEKRTYIDVELPHEAGEIAVLEVFRKQPDRELGHVPDDKAITCLTPRYDGVCGLVVHHLVAFLQKRWH